MFVYKTTNLINNKIYIGISKRKVESALFYLGSGKSLKRAVKKYGKENFSREILEADVNFTYKDLQEKEKYYIKFYNSTNTSIGYNISQGGDGNFGEVNGMWGKSHSKESIHKMMSSKAIKKKENPSYGKMSNEAIMKMRKFTAERNRINPTLPNGHSDESKRKISETVKRMIAEGLIARESRPFSDEKKELWSKMFSGEKNPFYGKTHNEETKMKIRDAHWGKMPPVARMNNDGDILEVYKHRGQVALFGFREDLVKLCYKGVNKLHKGFKWRLLTDDEFLHYKDIPEIDYRIV